MAVDPSIAQGFIQELPANIGSALALVPALEWAKRSAFPWLAWINTKTAPLISVLAAACLAAGIHGSFNPTNGTLVITGLTLAGIAQAGVEVGKQWLGQHWAFKFYQAFDTAKSLALALSKLANVGTSSVSGAEAGGVK